MTTMKFSIHIVLGGVAGVVPGSGVVLGDVLGDEITSGLCTSLESEFKKQGIHIKDLDVHVTDMDTEKRGGWWMIFFRRWTMIDLDISTHYTITNQEDVAIKNTKGLQRFALKVAHPLIKSLPKRVDHEVSKQVRKQICAQLPKQLKAGLNEKSICALRVRVRGREVA
jgi:hypothetical protein